MNIRARIHKVADGWWNAVLYDAETGTDFHAFNSTSWQYVLYRANRLVTDARRFIQKDNS